MRFFLRKLPAILILAVPVVLSGLLDGNIYCAERNALPALPDLPEAPAIRNMLLGLSAISKDADPEKSRQYLVNAFENGSNLAAYALGRFHYPGKGMMPDRGESLRYFEIACARGIVPACHYSKMLAEQGSEKEKVKRSARDELKSIRDVVEESRN